MTTTFCLQLLLGAGVSPSGFQVSQGFLMGKIRESRIGQGSVADNRIHPSSFQKTRIYDAGRGGSRNRRKEGPEA